MEILTRGIHLYSAIVERHSVKRDLFLWKHELYTLKRRHGSPHDGDQVRSGIQDTFLNTRDVRNESINSFLVTVFNQNETGIETQT